MKFLVLIVSVAFLGLNSSYAQNVKIKKDKVLLEGKLFLKYEKINFITHSIYDLNDNEILFVQFKDNETSDYTDDDFYVLNFINESIKVESSDYSRIASFMSSRKAIQKLIRWLVKDKVISADGSVNLKRLQIFFDKYDEKITNRTIRN
jgi:hypothetical protein